MCSPTFSLQIRTGKTGSGFGAETKYFQGVGKAGFWMEKAAFWRVRV
jgi:hypothetical protein